MFHRCTKALVLSAVLLSFGFAAQAQTEEIPPPTPDELVMFAVERITWAIESADEAEAAQRAGDPELVCVSLQMAKNHIAGFFEALVPIEALRDNDPATYAQNKRLADVVALKAGMEEMRANVEADGVPVCKSVGKPF